MKRPTREGLLAIGYIRVSTDGQAEEGVSLAVQESQVRAYAELYGFALLGIETDAGASAATLERPGLTRALATLERGEAEALIVPKLDRLTRSVRDLDTLLTNYFAPGRYILASVREQVDTTTATGRMVLHVLMSVAQWEREIIGERTREALAHKRSMGERMGQIPYGYSLGADGVHLEPDPEEQVVVARICEMKRSGMSLRGIVEQLNAGQTPARGAAWYRPTVTAIINREESK
jgi:DNA invertase Pin-like site-specific DNA recombinase